MSTEKKNLVSEFSRERFKEVRKATKNTMATLAKTIGVSMGYVSQIERGIKVPSETVEKLFVRQLNVNPDWWNTGEGEMFNSPEPITSGVPARDLQKHLEDIPTEPLDMRDVNSFERTAVYALLGISELDQKEFCRIALDAMETLVRLKKEGVSDK